MKGAVFFISKYGSAAQYANWISQGTDLPLHCITTSVADPSDYEFLVLVSPVYRFKLMVEDWVKRNIADVGTKPVILVTVSAAPPGPRLTAWIRDSLPASVFSRMKHIALRGRQERKDLTFLDRIWLKMAAVNYASPDDNRDEFGSFDYVDKSCVDVAVTIVRETQKTTPSRSPITKTAMRIVKG